MMHNQEMEVWIKDFGQSLGLTFEHREGSLMIVTLFILMTVCLMATVFFDLAATEFKCSYNDYIAQQGQLALDAGIEMMLDKIYLELNRPECLVAENLPEQLQCSNSFITFPAAVGEGQGTSGIVVKKAQLDGEHGTCVYEFTARGDYLNAHKNAVVQAMFLYEGGYMGTDGNGSPTRIPRSNYDRGRISTYQVKY
jgi:hypothetical protein